MAITPGGSLNSVAASQQQTLATNYIDFTSDTKTTFTIESEILHKTEHRYSTMSAELCWL